MSTLSPQARKQLAANVFAALSTPTEEESRAEAAVAALSKIAPDTSLSLLRTRPFVPLIVEKKLEPRDVVLPFSIQNLVVKGFIKVVLNVSDRITAPCYQISGFAEAMALLSISVDGDTLSILGEPDSALDHDDLTMPFLVTIHVSLPSLSRIQALNASQVSGTVLLPNGHLTCEAQQYALYSLNGIVDKLSYIGSHRSLANLSGLVVNDLHLLLINSAKYEGIVNKTLSGEVQDTSAALCMGSASECTLKWGTVNVNVVLMLENVKNWVYRSDLDTDSALPAFADVYNEKAIRLCNTDPANGVSEV